jgi:hypothetical protein
MAEQYVLKRTRRTKRRAVSPAYLSADGHEQIVRLYDQTTDNRDDPTWVEEATKRVQPNRDDAQLSSNQPKHSVDKRLFSMTEVTTSDEQFHKQERRRYQRKSTMARYVGT